MDRKLMLDSGAFSVWSKGAKIDLDEYADFCIAHPKTSYFVSLDVIPGSPGAQYRTPTMVEEAASQGWKNYLRMLRKGVPFEKLIPVFHQGESLKWLEKMLDIEAPYIGLGGIAQCGRKAAISWLRSLRHLLLDSDGKPKVKVHGFAVNDFSVLKMFPWCSVDSSTWGTAASFGEVWIPSTKQGEFLRLGITSRCPKVGPQNHYDFLSPIAKRIADDWFSGCGVKIGSKQESEDHRCTLRDCPPTRRVVNSKAMDRTSELLGVLIYLAGTAAGNGCGTDSEIGIIRRLLAYSMIRGSEGKLFQLLYDRLPDG